MDLRQRGLVCPSSSSSRQELRLLPLSRTSRDLLPRSATILEVWSSAGSLPSAFKHAKVYSDLHTPPTFHFLCHSFPCFSFCFLPFRVNLFITSPAPPVCSHLSPTTVGSVPLSPPLLVEPGSARGDGKLVQMTRLT